MYLKEYSQYPKNDYLILLNSVGEPKLQIEQKYSIRPAKDITDKIITVYNIETDRVSDKSVYLNNDGKEFVKGKSGFGGKSKRFYIEDFK
jgi:hypothetical protein